MKKVLFILFVASIFASCAPLDIATDKLELNGERYTKTTAKEIDARVSAWMYKENNDYVLTMKLRGIDVADVSKGRKCLLKLSDGDIMEFENLSDSKAVIPTDCQCAFIPYVVVQYRVTKDQMNECYNIGTEKLRIETDLGYYTVPSKELGDIFLKMYKLIRNQCEIKNDIYYNF